METTTNPEGEMTYRVGDIVEIEVSEGDVREGAVVSIRERKNGTYYKIGGIRRWMDSPWVTAKRITPTGRRV